MALNQKLHSPLFNALSKSKKSLSKLFKNVYYLDQTLRNYDDHHSFHTFYFGSESFRFNSDKEINGPFAVLKTPSVSMSASSEKSQIFRLYGDTDF